MKKNIKAFDEVRIIGMVQTNLLVIRDDIGEYSSDLFSSREQILTDAYLMSEIERLIIELFNNLIF